MRPSTRRRNQLKKQLRRESRNTWRGFVEQTTANVGRGHNAGLWRLSRWARMKAGRPRELPHLPPLRRDEHSPYPEAEILAEKFFPPPEDADLSDMVEGASQTAPGRIFVERNVTVATMQEVIRRLPGKKTPGLDGIANEILKLCSDEISGHLADIARACFEVGYHPKDFRRTVAVVLRKEAKPDYSVPGSYRPIALENTLGKVVEKRVADRLSTAMEDHALFPDTQMALSQLVGRGAHCVGPRPEVYRLDAQPGSVWGL
jgi:hypothetical protein